MRPDAMPDNRILLLHSGDALAQALEGTLTRLGYVLVGVESSRAEALELVAGGRPHVVMIQLSLKDATAIAAEIAQRWPLPVIFLARPGDEPALGRAGVAGPFGYVLEPYAEREVRMNLQMALLTEKVRTQEYELEERFFAVNIDMLCCLDFNGYFKRLNPAWERTLGFTRAELMSKPFIEFVHPDDRERTLNQNREVRSGGNALGFENRYLCKDGSFRWFLWNAAPDFDQRVIYSVARDITERKRADEERESLVLELRFALAEVKSLQAILPICSYCKKIRNDANYWTTVESYISEHTNSTFTHGICPSCYEKEVAPQLDGRHRR